MFKFASAIRVASSAIFCHENYNRESRWFIYRRGRELLRP